LILYLDTSALVKRYVREDYSDEITSMWKTADYLATSFVAHAEALAAFHRKRREDDLPGALFDRLIGRFREEWESLLRVEVNAGLEPYVLELSERHSLRGFDLIHLASAVVLHERVCREANDTLVFACFDQTLAGAARAEGIAVFPG